VAGSFAVFPRCVSPRISPQLVSADDVLKGVAETGPNYTLLPKRERKAKRRRRRR